MKKVLFVCTGNTCRSPMAELMFNDIAIKKGIKARAQSAGLCTIEGLLINDNSKEALEEMNIKSDFFRSTDIYDLDMTSFDLVVSMTEEHMKELRGMGIDSEKLFMLSSENGGVKDPYGHSPEVYKACRDEIYNSLEEVFEAL